MKICGMTADIIHENFMGLACVMRRIIFLAAIISSSRLSTQTRSYFNKCSLFLIICAYCFWICLFYWLDWRQMARLFLRDKISINIFKNLQLVWLQIFNIIWLPILPLLSCACRLNFYISVDFCRKYNYINRRRLPSIKW